MRLLPFTGIFTLASLLAVAAGCWIVATNIRPSGIWIPNAIAWAIGATLATLLTRLRPAILFPIILLLTPLALEWSLLTPGPSNVRRWVQLGPLSWNVAFLLLPAASVAITASARGRWPAAWWIALFIQIALCLQPDASQATAFAAAILTTLVTSPAAPAARASAALLCLLTAGLAWTRPDPLSPVPEVEGILQLAHKLSPAITALCLVSLLTAAAAPLLACRHAGPHTHPAARALATYFLTITLLPFLGAFPIPLVGMSMSPILGFWLGIGTLLALCRQPPSDSGKAA